MSTDRVKKRSRRPRNEEEQEEERQHGLDDEKPQQTVRPRSQHGKRNNTAPQPQQPTASAASSQQLVAPPQSDVDKKKKRRRKRARRDAASDTDAAAASPAAPSPSSAPLPHVPVGCFKAFVGGLPYDVSEAELTAFFQRDGCFVWSVRIAQYREGHQFESQQRGFAHVEFENESQVARSLQRNGELWSDGKHCITVQIAKPKRSDSTADAEAAAVVSV